MTHKWLPPIHIHPVLLLFVLISIPTGMFMEMIIIFSIVFIHEIGHYLMARYFKWRIRRIMLWVFGGVMETEENLSKSVKEELIVTLAGPIQHLFIAGFLYLLLDLGVLPVPIFETAIVYNLTILLFNLLPIWPLDGGKILFSLLSLYFPFRKALDLIFISSIIFCIALVIGHIFFFPFTLTFTLIMLFLFLENRREWKRRFFIFMRFLLQRYYGKSRNEKVESLHVSGKQTLLELFRYFKREKRHLIIINKRKQIDETTCLHAYFEEQNHSKRLEDLFL